MNGPMADAGAVGDGATAWSTRAMPQTLNRMMAWAAIAVPNAPPARCPR